MRPTKTQISLGIHPVWSEPLLCVQWVAKDPTFLHADSEDWSDWAEAQADLSLRWAHSHIVGFVMRRLKFTYTLLPVQECNFRTIKTDMNLSGFWFLYLEL